MIFLTLLHYAHPCEKQYGQEEMWKPVAHQMLPYAESKQGYRGSVFPCSSIPISFVHNNLLLKVTPDTEKRRKTWL